MSEEGVTDVTVPTATYYLTWKALDATNVSEMLDRVGSSSKLSGIHGVALVSVTAQTESGDVKLARGQTVDIPLSADLTFVVKVQNQGSVKETDVPVTATLTVPGSTPLKQQASIASIAPDQTQDVSVPAFAIGGDAVSKVCVLKVVAGPVPGESTETNNTATYKLMLQLK